MFTLYQDDIGMRSMGDIDILVRKEDLLEAENILKRIGYIEYYGKQGRKARRDLYSKYHYHYLYAKDQVMLELHWDIGYKSDILTLKKIFDSCDKLIIEGKELRILKPECNIFIACNNFNQDYLVDAWGTKFKDEHAWKAHYFLFFAYEVKKLIQYYGDKIAWDNLLSLVKSAKKEYELFTLLILAKKIAGADVPKIFLKKARRNISVSLYIFLCRMVRYDNFVGLFTIREIFLIKSPKILYRKTRAYLYMHNRASYFLIKRLTGRLKSLKAALNK